MTVGGQPIRAVGGDGMPRQSAGRVGGKVRLKWGRGRVRGGGWRSVGWGAAEC